MIDDIYQTHEYIYIHIPLLFSPYLFLLKIKREFEDTHMRDAQ